MISGGYNNLSTKLRWKYLLSRENVEALFADACRMILAQSSVHRGSHVYRFPQPQTQYFTQSVLLSLGDRTLSWNQNSPSSCLSPARLNQSCRYSAVSEDFVPAQPGKPFHYYYYYTVHSHYSCQSKSQLPFSGSSWTLFHLLKQTNKNPNRNKKKPHQTIFAFKSCCMHFFKKILLKIKNQL